MYKVKLKGGTVSLFRDGDGSGDSGRMFECICPVEAEVVATHEIRVGHVMRCGSYFALAISNLARTFSAQDWWMTTPVTEIISEKIEEQEPGVMVQVVKVKTNTSTYTVSCVVEEEDSNE